jgi:hypothetical protein
MHDALNHIDLFLNCAWANQDSVNRQVCEFDFLVAALTVAEHRARQETSERGVRVFQLLREISLVKVSFQSSNCNEAVIATRSMRFQKGLPKVDHIHAGKWQLLFKLSVHFHVVGKVVLGLHNLLMVARALLNHNVLDGRMCCLRLNGSWRGNSLLMVVAASILPFLVDNSLSFVS